MKATITWMFYVGAIVFLLLPSRLFAQVPDTVLLYANPPGVGNAPTIDQFIAADTTATGERNNPNRVYVLQQTGAIDTPYYFTNTILEKGYNLTIVGKINPVTGKPPVVAPIINPDGSTPDVFIQATGGHITLTGLYMLGLRPDKSGSASRVALVNGDSTRLTLDHCIIDDFGNSTIIVTSYYNNFFISNCEFRDLFTKNGGGIQINGGRDADTISITNSTFFGVMFAEFQNLKYIGYLHFEHNTSVLGTWDPIDAPQMQNAVIKNNIWYGLCAYGVDSALKAGQDLSAGSNHNGYSIIFLDTLTTLNAPPYNLTEADRNVTIENNAYGWPKAYYDYWKSVRDTATDPGQITPPSFMNDLGVQISNNHTKWPGFVVQNNDSTDPGFSSSVIDPAVDSLLGFVNLLWSTGSAGSYDPFTFKTDPLNVFANVKSDWASTQGYAVPENLSYTADLKGSDGLPLGDLNWFPNITGIKEINNYIPSEFKLSQNYPNPFNPTTVINYAIPKSSFISLKVYNILGQEVATLFQGFQKAGYYKIDFNGSTLASGVYLYRIQSNGYSETKKMLLMK